MNFTCVTEMKTEVTLRVTLLLAILIVGAHSTVAAEWHGIVPVHSTRGDVVRIFNECKEEKERCSFDFAEQHVIITFSGWQHAFGSCPRTVPRDTVLLVDVLFPNHTRMQDLKIKLKSFRQFDPSYPGWPGYRGYIDQSAGLLIQSYKGQVRQVSYIASRKDQ